MAPRVEVGTAREGGGHGAAWLWALAIFVVINGVVALSASGLTSVRDEQSATYQACDSAVEQFMVLEPAPDVVLMGSSVVMAPFWSCDFKRFGGVRDVYHHHRSFRMERVLAEAGLEGKRVFSFGLPGAMVSDIYLIADKLFSGAHVPETIVYGLSPRDFMDDLLTGETRTAVFQRLMTLSDMPRLGDRYLSSWQEKAEFALNNCFYLYGKRCRYQNKAEAVVDRVYDRVIPQAVLAAGTTDAGREGNFLQEADRDEVWARSIEEYRARYRRYNASQFAKQESFLESLLAVARQRGVTVILANMPLTPENMALMPQGLYNRYLKAIKKLSERYDCAFLDLNASGAYGRSHFYDTVHLNAEGGDRLVAQLSTWLAGKAELERLAQRK